MKILLVVESASDPVISLLKERDEGNGPMHDVTVLHDIDAAIKTAHEGGGFDVVIADHRIDRNGATRFGMDLAEKMGDVALIIVHRQTDTVTEADRNLYILTPKENAVFEHQLFSTLRALQPILALAKQEAQAAAVWELRT